ncbi:uncharacterized protein LOC107488895 [Arachis duranensis]|uniref:Uncharacterized protein LOC107488895 n=1 Tax=Arachis duranensis TaxID=130453 RepID=A0A6P4DAV9_ARADU|nr:uncharacterized protein LOC107488895 [Arachis duranensis]
MSKEGSARVSKQEEDLVQHSTKKVKTRASVDLNQPSEDMEVTGPCDGNKSGASKISYKDTLLTVAGSIIEDEHVDMEEVNEDISDPENRWYQDADKETHEEEPFNPCPTIPISKEEFDEWCKPWRSALYVKLLGKRVGLGFMEQRLKRDWGKKGSINVIDMDRDYFLVHFADTKDYSYALMEGPWMIAGHYLIVQRWRPFFLESEKVVRKIAAWIQIPNLPIELYNQKFLWRVGSTIGHMLKIDRSTSIHSRGRFARICVKIDLAKKLVPRISVLGSELYIEYEGLHQICFSCGKYGHRSDLCTDEWRTKL